MCSGGLQTWPTAQLLHFLSLVCKESKRCYDALKSLHDLLMTRSETEQEKNGDGERLKGRDYGLAQRAQPHPSAQWISIRDGRAEGERGEERGGGSQAGDQPWKQESHRPLLQLHPQRATGSSTHQALCCILNFTIII